MGVQRWEGKKREMECEERKGKVRKEEEGRTVGGMNKEMI